MTSAAVLYVICITALHLTCYALLVPSSQNMADKGKRVPGRIQDTQSSLCV